MHRRIISSRTKLLGRVISVERSFECKVAAAGQCALVCSVNDIGNVLLTYVLCKCALHLCALCQFATMQSSLVSIGTPIPWWPEMQKIPLDFTILVLCSTNRVGRKNDMGNRRNSLTMYNCTAVDSYFAQWSTPGVEDDTKI